MSEGREGYQPNLEKIKLPEPIGIRMLGEKDPSQLTREQFYLSKDLLYHGSKRIFSFDRSFTYDDRKNLEFEGSTTLGFGFYTTPNSNDASDYSLVRSIAEKDTPFVMAILPYQAAILDLRSQEDPKYNGAFPVELAKKWQETYLNFYNTRTPLPENNIINRHFNKTYREYVQYLDTLIESKNFTIRELLGTIEFGNRPWANTFSNFMRDQGIDGVVALEQSEKDKTIYPETYVFYNMQKIGDYETWHPATT